MKWTALLCFLLATKLMALDSYTYRIHGGAIQGHVDEVMTIDKEGNFSYRSLSPASGKAVQNAIGSFKIKASLEDYSNIQKLIQDHQAELDKFKTELQLSTVTEELLSHDKSVAAWWSGNKNLFPIRDAFIRLAEAAVKSPEAALNLSCKKDKKTANCRYTNIGREKLETIDPASLGRSLICLGPFGERTILNDEGDPDPRKQSPKKVALGPGEVFTFSFALKPECDHRLVVKTTDLLINHSFAGVLLGELVSEPLTK